MSHWALWLVIALFSSNILFTFVKNIKSDKSNFDLAMSVFVFLIDVAITVFAIIEIVR